MGKRNTLIALLAVGALAAGANAFMISNGPTTLFDAGGFEGDSIGLPPSSASPGTWSTDSHAGQHPVVNDLSPGPFEGSNYLKLAGPATGTFIRADYAPQTSGTLRVETMAYVDSSSGVGNQFYFCEPGTGTGGAKFYFSLSGAGDLIADEGNVLGAVPTNTWIPVVFEYALGASDFDITIDGTMHNRDIGGRASSNLGGILIRHGGGGTNLSYLDAVPEPGTLGVVAIGAVLTLLRRRRR